MENQVTKTKFDSAKLINGLKKVGNYTFILLVLASGFFLGRMSHEILPKVEVKPSVRTANEISVAINESNQMLIIDKRTGKYDVFADSVGMTIFRLYAGKIYQNQAGK